MADAVESRPPPVDDPPRAAGTARPASATSSTSSIRESMTFEQALSIAGWPASLATDEAKQPWIVNDVRVFKELLLFGSHIDRIIVLPDGVRLLGLDNALPPDIAAAAEGQTCVRRFLERLGDESALEKLRARIYITPPDSRDEQELKDARDKKELDTLADKRRALLSDEEPRQCHQNAGVYLGELRRAQRYRHNADGAWSKSLLSRGACDAVGRTRHRAMPYWDRYDEGIFVGARFGGSPMHVDQVHWSNVGKNWSGHKLFAVWPYGEASRDLFDAHNYSLLMPPLAAAEAQCLKAACQVALLGPGDVVLFSGGCAHMALSVSSQLSITAYESFVNLHPRNLACFLDSGTPNQYRQCRTRQPMLDDIKGDVCDSVNDLCQELEDGVVKDAELEAAAPAAIEALRRDGFIAARVAPLRQPQRKRQRRA